MPEATKKPAAAVSPAADSDPGFDFEPVAERIRDLNERIISSSMQAGEATLAAYARMLESIAELQDNVGKASPVEWLTTFATAQANLTRDLAEHYSSAARKLAN